MKNMEDIALYAEIIDIAFRTENFILENKLKMKKSNEQKISSRKQKIIYFY